ncbi:hypothetical protein ACS0TY_032304 [Phlomoides rotata]
MGKSRDDYQLKRSSPSSPQAGDETKTKRHRRMMTRNTNPARVKNLIRFLNVILIKIRSLVRSVRTKAVSTIIFQCLELEEMRVRPGVEVDIVVLAGEVEGTDLRLYQVLRIQPCRYP